MKSKRRLSTAFAVTPDDVFNVMKDAGEQLGYCYAEEIFERHIKEHVCEGGRIEKAALYGNDLDEQTKYAYEEITKILVEEGVIAKK